MSNTNHFDCETCFDTLVIDHAGAEIDCPNCANRQRTIKLTGLMHGLGNQGRNYDTCTAHTSSTITFRGTPSAILADVSRVLLAAKGQARQQHRTGRNSVSSGAVAISKRVREALS